jgi:Fe-S-cluster-containing dehydrogenase component
MSRSERRPDPHVGWEAWARTVLGGADVDAGLGVEVARDAMAVAAGGLEEDEFRDRYENDYLKEFGVDHRPRLADGLTTPDREPAVTGRDPAAATDDRDGRSGLTVVTSSSEGSEEPQLVPRRAVLGVLGGAAAGALFFGEAFRRGAFASRPGIGDPLPLAGASGAGAAPGGGTLTPGEQTGVQFGMVIDLERCDGCLRCVDACVEENGLSDGVLWPYVFAYQEPGDVDPRYLPRLCQHCTRAPCVMVCPTGARHRRLADGLVLTDYDVCIGCRYCQVACPYGANVFQFADPATYGGSFTGERRDVRGVAVKGDPPKGVMGKCTFCPLRQDDPERRGTAACVDACSMEALHIGDLNDPDSAPNRYLAKRREEAGGNLPTFRLLEDLGTEPNIIYIGQPPSPQAELVEGDWAYEDWGLTEDRRAVLEGPEPWFRRLAQKA